MKKRLLWPYLLIVCIVSLLAGCTININRDTPSKNATKETGIKAIFDYIFNGEEKPTMYESRATIYITTYTDDKTAISSSDIAAKSYLVNTYNIILQTIRNQSQICEEYPEIDYTISLEPVNNTEIFALIVKGESPEHLEQICNMAVSLFCETVQQMIDGASCRIVDHAKPAQEVETN